MSHWPFLNFQRKCILKQDICLYNLEMAKDDKETEMMEAMGLPVRF